MQKLYGKSLCCFVDEAQFHIIQEVEETILCLMAGDDGVVRKIQENVGSVSVCESASASWVLETENIIHSVHRTCLTADTNSTILHVSLTFGGPCSMTLDDFTRLEYTPTKVHKLIENKILSVGNL